MRIDNVKRPETSFLSVEKDMETIVTEIFKNERIKRLLFYNCKDSLDRADIDTLPEYYWPLKKEMPDGRIEWRNMLCLWDEEKAKKESAKAKEEGFSPVPPTASLFMKNVKIVPKIKVDREADNYIIVSFDNFTGNATNPQFRDNIISFDIVCHFDQWHLGNFKLRPYRLAAELDGMLDGKHLSGIGTLEFLGCNQIILNDEFGGLSLMFLAIHGDDDKVPNPTKPLEVERFEKDFKEMFTE